MGEAGTLSRVLHGRGVREAAVRSVSNPSPRESEEGVGVGGLIYFFTTK
jgi:hypothetical protein